MDPWLELHWRDVHSSLIIYIRNHIQRQLPEPLVARAEEDVMVDIDEQAAGRVRPDVQVLEDRPRSSTSEGGVATLPPPPDLTEPWLVRVPEPEVDRRVEIVDPSSGGRVITAIEVLSPSNKLHGPAQLAYRSKQRDFLAAGVNLVEIDLVRAGDWVFSVDETVVAPDERTPYMVCIFRATQPDRRGLFFLPLQKRLPRIAIPLRPHDQDVVLDLQAVVDEAYETGRYDRTDYRRALKPPLAPEDAAWASEMLHKAGHL